MIGSQWHTASLFTLLDSRFMKSCFPICRIPLTSVSDRPSTIYLNQLVKLALFGISEIKVGIHNLKDPRLDQANKLVEADKKTHAQVDVIGQDQLLDADAIVASPASKADLILRDLEFVETRLSRDPQQAERATLAKLKS